eukprot:SAG31_NODE_5515_length_2484_cov_4.819287_4_plen_344_part_01
MENENCSVDRDLPDDCTAVCAVSVRQFLTHCRSTLDAIWEAGDPSRVRVEEFETQCMISAGDMEDFLQAITEADCPLETATTRCTTSQTEQIAACEVDCLSCDFDAALSVLDGCLTAEGNPAVPGVSFCVRDGVDCSETQHAALAQCLSSCADCEKDSAALVLGDCRANTDSVWNGVAAISLIDVECRRGAPCSPLQQTVASSCISNCAACDFINAGIVLEMCTEEGHGIAMEFVEEQCSASQAESGATGGSNTVDVSSIVTQTSASTPPYCSMLQSAIMSQCHSDCDSCDVNNVRLIIGDCMLENGSPAWMNMCTHVALPPSSDPDACSPLQEAVIRSCSDDC